MEKKCENEVENLKKKKIPEKKFILLATISCIFPYHSFCKSFYKPFSIDCHYKLHQQIHVQHNMGLCLGMLIELNMKI